MKRAMAIAAGVIAFASYASAQSGEYWTDPTTGERIKILESRPIPVPLRTMFEDRRILISGTAPAKCHHYPVPQLRFMLIGQTATDVPSAEPLQFQAIVLRCGSLYGQEYEVQTNSVHKWASFARCAFRMSCVRNYESRTTGDDLDHSMEFRIDKDPSWKMRINWGEQTSTYLITQERNGKAEIVDAGFCRESRDLPQLPAPVPVRQSAGADTTNAPRAEIKVVAPETDAHPAIIIISGRFKKGDNIRFFDAVEKIQNATIYLDSPGGNTYAGIGIGEIIRERGFHTAVINYGKCLSACAIAWLGGTKRYVGGFAEVGFHHPSFGKDIVLDEATAARAMEYALGIINSYVVSMLDLSKDAAGFVTVVFPTNPRSVNYLTPEDGEQYGIAFTRKNIPGYDPLP